MEAACPGCGVGRGHEAGAFGAEGGAEAEALADEEVPAEEPREGGRHVVELAVRHDEERAGREPELGDPRHRGRPHAVARHQLLQLPRRRKSRSLRRRRRRRRKRRSRSRRAQVPPERVRRQEGVVGIHSSFFFFLVCALGFILFLSCVLPLRLCRGRASHRIGARYISGLALAAGFCCVLCYACMHWLTRQILLLLRMDPPAASACIYSCSVTRDVCPMLEASELSYVRENDLSL